MSQLWRFGSERSNQNGKVLAGRAQRGAVIAISDRIGERLLSAQLEACQRARNATTLERVVLAPGR
jgi:hypothetical protein